MSPLVALLLLGFLFVIALCLTVWAALSWIHSPRDRRIRETVTYVPLSRPAPDDDVWSTGASAPAAAVSTGDVSGETSLGTVRVRQRRNDDFRGANATVTGRPNLDDAFERFVDQERKDRY